MQYNAGAEALVQWEVSSLALGACVNGVYRLAARAGCVCTCMCVGVSMCTHATVCCVSQSYSDVHHSISLHILPVMNDTLQHTATHCNTCVAVCCSVLQCVTVFPCIYYLDEC